MSRESLSRQEFEGLPEHKRKEMFGDLENSGCDTHYTDPKNGCILCLKSQLEMELAVQRDMDGHDESLPVVGPDVWLYPEPSKN